eukprot:SAG25_NODE_4338_length_837_cov_0.957995_1_plen_48_part_10
MSLEQTHNIDIHHLLMSDPPHVPKRRMHYIALQPDDEWPIKGVTPSET